MTAATISIKVNGARRQPLSVFNLEVRGKTEANNLVVGVEDILRGLGQAMRNQVDGLRQQGISEDAITRLLVDVWPFREDSA